MYSNSDVEWLSQIIFSHKDKIYGTDGYMRSSITMQTKDSMTFSAPSLSINIQNDSVNKTVMLSYQKIFDLYNRLKSVVDSAAMEYTGKEGNPDTQLHFKVGKSNFLTFDFLRGVPNNEPVVRISISHGTSDSTRIIMPFFPDFHSFISLIGDMVGNRKYLDWCLNFPSLYFMNKANSIIQQIPGLIKGAVVQMDNSRNTNNTPGSPAPIPETEPEEPTTPVDEGNTSESADTMKELDAFIGENMKNIDLEFPGSETEKKVDSSAKDSRFYKWCDGDIKNIENLILRCCEKENPLRELEKDINQNYGDFDCFPKLTSKEAKSMAYLMAREYQIIAKEAIQSPIKRGFSVNRYNGLSHATPDNFELMYDLIMTNIYFKLCREKIENKTSDNYTNKTFLHLGSAVYLAPFIFSFMKAGTEISTIVRDRFKKYDAAGVFDSFKNSEYKTYNFSINEFDMKEAADMVTEGYYDGPASKTDSLMRHVGLFSRKQCILDPENKLNEEQIINQVIPLEIFIIFGNKSFETDKKEIVAYAEENKLDKVILSEFIKTKPQKKIPILKFFEDHIAEIPEDLQQHFVESLKEHTDRDFDLMDNKFPYESFGEKAIKALFLWKPETGMKFTNYSKFYKAIINSTQNKDTILSMIEHENDTDTSDESFSDFYGKGK